jgi:hypothetical protein
VSAPLGTTEAGTARPGCAEILPLTTGSSQHESMNIDGLLVVDAFLAPYTIVPRHAHENPGLGVLLDGEMEIDIVGITRSCTASTVGTEPRWEEHVNRVGPSGARIVSIEGRRSTRRPRALRPTSRTSPRLEGRGNRGHRPSDR